MRENAEARPRSWNRSIRTPRQREAYIAGCLLALERLKGRLERGLIIVRSSRSVDAERLWLRLGARSLHLIALLSAASDDAGYAFCESDLGRWYAALEWPEVSEAALMEEL